MRIKFLNLPFVIFLLIFFIFFYLLLIDRDNSEIPSNLINKKTPNFIADTLIGDKKFISTEEFGKEVFLVNFFATWCKPCRDEHAYIKKIAISKKIKILGINYKDNSQMTIKWLNDLGNPYTNIIKDENGEIAIDWGVYGIPETFIVGSDGLIKFRHVGPITRTSYKKIGFLINENN